MELEWMLKFFEDRGMEQSSECVVVETKVYPDSAGKLQIGCDFGLRVPGTDKTVRPIDWCNHTVRPALKLSGNMVSGTDTNLSGSKSED